MKVLSDILHKAGILKESAEAYSSGGYSVLVRNTTTQRFETLPSSAFTNIYTADGTLTGNRTVNSGGYSLTLNPNLNLSGSLFGNTSRTRDSFASSYTQPATVFSNADYTFDGLTSTGNTLYMGQSKIEVTGGSSAVQSQGIDIEQHIKLSGASSRIAAQNYILQYRGYSGDISTNANNYMAGFSISTGHSKYDTSTSIVSGTTTGYQSTIFNNVGTITNAIGFNNILNATTSSAHKSSTISNYYAFRSIGTIGATSGTSTATITNYYGLYLDAINVRATGTITNRWGVYAPDAAMNHYINGNVVVGTSTLSGYKLDVTGVTRSTTRLMAGIFTPGAGITADDKIVSDGFVRAAGINMRPANVGDNIFIGLQSGSGDIQLWANNANVGQINAIGSGAGSILRIGGYGYNPGAGASGFRNSILIDNAISPTGNNAADYVMVHLNPQIGESDISGSYTSGSIRGFYYNPAISVINTTTHYAWESTAGKFKISDLAGTGSRMVIVDSSGVLSAASFSTATNIYNSDGTLSGNRTVTMGSYTLNFNGNVGIGGYANTKLHVDGSDNSTLFRISSPLSASGGDFYHTLQFGRPAADYGVSEIRNTANLSSSYESRMTFRLSNVSNTIANVMHLIGSGKVGINTLNPAHALDVSGVIRAYADATYNGENGAIIASNSTNTDKRVFVGYDGTIDAGFLQPVHSGFAYKNLLLNAAGGNVIVGSTTDVGYLFQVNGGSAYVKSGGIVADLNSTINQALYATGQSLTSAASNGLIYLESTWNTTGNPSAIYMNITNTSSGSLSKLLDLRVGGTGVFQVDKAGGILTGQPTGGTAGVWKLGQYNATAPSSTGYVEVEINGTLYKLIAST